MCNKNPMRGTLNFPESTYEQVLQDSIGQFCDDSMMKKGMNMWLDCRFRDNWANALSISDWDGTPKVDEWIDRAWVTYFKGPSTGMYGIPSRILFFKMVPKGLM